MGLDFQGLQCEDHMLDWCIDLWNGLGGHVGWLGC